MGGMRIVCVSDTHGHNITVPDGDVLIHAGDATVWGTLTDAIRLNNWFGRQPHQFKFYVPGNHDWIFQIQYGLVKATLQNAVLLLDEQATFEFNNRNWTIYGTPWTPTFRNWAFMCDTEKELLMRFRRIPSVDILVSHGPPFGIFDRQKGSKALCDVVYKTKPELCVFGHIHDGEQVMTDNTTIFVNASICDDENNIAFEPVMVGL